jgi:predicted ester cyclase
VNTIIEQNKAIARSFFAAVDALDRTTLNGIYDPGFQLEFPGSEQPLDREAHWGLITGYHTAFSDMAHRPDILTAEDDRVIVRGTILGTNDGPLLGQPPTGRKVDVQFMTMMTFRNGRLARLFTLLDFAKLQKQLGVDKVLHGGR